MGIKKHIGYLKTDFRGELAFLFSFIYRKIYGSISTIYCLCNFFIKNIEVGRNNKFIGTLWVSRFQNSTIKIGSNCIFLSKKTSNALGLYRPCMLSTHSQTARIEIGDGCSFSGTSIGSLKLVSLGKNVRCGANTLITDTDWHTDDPRSGGSADVIIEDNVWLGTNSVVLKGVRIGKNTLIGANSLVVRDIPANVIAGGNPCKVIKHIQEI